MATCNTNALLSNASQLASLPPGAQRIVRLGLLLGILQAKNPSFVLNINDLLSRAGQFQSMTPGEVKIVRLQLYCEILGGIA